MFDWFRKWSSWSLGDQWDGRVSLTVENNTHYFDSYDKPYHYRYLGLSIARQAQDFHITISLWWVTIDCRAKVFPAPKETL